jgi:predicted Zn finger-like uncharacterized protein
MILTCPACQTRYEVDATKFPSQGRSVRCARCGEIWHADADPEAPVTAPPPEPAPAPPAPVETPREVYAQPIPRDPEPQESDYSYEEAPAAASSRSGLRRPMLLAGWAALIAVVLLIGIAAASYRQQVVEAWPQSASLYAKLGMKVAANSIRFGNTKTSREIHGGAVVLTVSGSLTNVTDRELPVPQIRIGLVDGERRELYHWTVAPDVIALKPGQSTRFVTQLSNPPESAVDYRIRFAKAGE